jgi:hypothetical protein
VPITLERTPEEIQILAKVLFDTGHSIGQVKKRTGLSNDTAIAIKRKNDYSASMLEEFKRRLPFKSYRWADDVLDIITVDEVKKAPLTAKVMLYGVAIDKARDMEGSNRPIFNIVSVVNDCNKTLGKLNEQMGLIAQAKASRSIVVT